MTSSDNDDRPYSVELGDFIEIQADMKWECVMCGTCCRNIHSKTWLYSVLSDPIHITIDGRCKFLDIENGNRCERYDTRPNVCRGYPFVIKKKGDHYVLTVHKGCSGIGKGSILDVRKRLIYTLELVEEDLGIEFIVREVGENDFKMYKIK